MSKRLFAHGSLRKRGTCSRKSARTARHGVLRARFHPPAPTEQGGREERGVGDRERPRQVRKPEAPQLPVLDFQLRKEECSLPLQYLALQKIIQKFRREVTLDPETAHPHLLASEGKKSVTFVRKKPGVPQNPKRLLMDAVVLGSEGLDGGRHSWGVQVGGKRERAAGLWRGSLSRKARWPPSGRSRRGTVRRQDGACVAEGKAQRGWRLSVP